MIRKYHKAFIGVYVLIVLAGVIWHAGGVSAEDTIKLTVNSHTTSTAKMQNMQPGDTTTTEYTVINGGNEQFDYYVDFKFLSGDVELYNILQMTLQKEGVILYSGVMSEAAGRVAVGTLAGDEQETIQMNVTFPPEAGNEYQAKTTSVAFDFSASATPAPTASPSATPTASVTPVPSVSPSITPQGSPAPTDSPPYSEVPGIPATPSASPAVTASPGATEVTVTDPPVPLGGNDPTASPGAGAAVNGSAPSPSPDNEVTFPDDELPLAAPGDDRLPDTAEPWYNLILLSLAVAIVSIIVLRRLNSKK